MRVRKSIGRNILQKEQVMLNVLTIVAIAMIGCAGVAVKEAGGYPMGTTENPNVLGLMDAAKADGFMIRGLGTDVIGNNIIWLEDKDGNCVAFMLDNQRMEIHQFESCENALEVWNMCLEANECIDPAEKI
jgi:hypothetical protein